MSRFRSSGSYGHRIWRISHDHYRLQWVVDRYYPNSRLRHSRGFHRDTDLAGAHRFARKWNLVEPPGDQENAVDG